MIKRTCDFCAKTFLIHPYREKRAHFCSNNCYHNQQKKSAYQIKICPFCRKEFILTRNTRQNKYCSKECSILGRRKYLIKGEKVKWADKEKTKIYKWRGEKICIYCKKIFKYTSKNINQKYCSVACQIKSRAYKVDENFFNKINSEGNAYLLGLIFSDGSISKNRINFSSIDKDQVEICKKLLKSESPIYQYQNSFFLIIGNQKLCSSLKKLGILERKSWREYSIPLIPKKLIRHFLRGIFDGDGCFYIDDRKKWKYLCAIFSCNSRKFLQEIKEWLEKNNIKTQNIRFDKKPNNTGCWQLKIASKKNIKKFTDYLYKDINYFLNRKYQIVKSFYDK